MRSGLRRGLRSWSSSLAGEGGDQDLQPLEVIGGLPTGSNVDQRGKMMFMEWPAEGIAGREQSATLPVGFGLGLPPVNVKTKGITAQGTLSLGLWCSCCQSVVNLAFEYDADGVRELQRLVWTEQTLATLSKKYPQIYDKALEHVLTKAHFERMYCYGSEA